LTLHVQSFVQICYNLRSDKLLIKNMYVCMVACTSQLSAYLVSVGSDRDICRKHAQLIFDDAGKGEMSGPSTFRTFEQPVKAVSDVVIL